MQKINYLDLFSGCGGFRLGLQKAGITPTHEFHSEIDKNADQIYKKHYSNSENLGDVTKIKTDGTIRGHKINLITFGFPCQDLSIAGKQEGLGGSRSGLFYEATRLIRELKPEVFIFENVKGLFSSQNGADFTEVLREIADIGLYECEWQLLNTRWVLPQNRERVFFAGRIGGTRGRTKIFPITETDFQHSKTVNKTTKEIRYSQCLTTRSAKSRQGADYTWIRSQDEKIREMTPLEWERLQGFFDNWTAGVSDAQRYRMLGNAVTSDLADVLYKKIYNI